MAAAPPDSAKLLGVHCLSFSADADGIRSATKALIADYQKQLDGIAASTGTSGRDLFLSTIGQLADADGHAALKSAELTMPALVGSDPAARAASSEAKKQLQQMWAQAYMRQDLYRQVADASKFAEGPEEQRLVEVMLGKFRFVGAHIEDDAVRKEVARLDARCASLAFEIEQNINEDCTSLVLTEEELEGCSPDFIKSLPKEEDGETPRRRCSVKAPVLVPIMKRATRPETRRKMMEVNQRQCMDKNGPLLAELVETRQKAAKLIGFPSHADRMLKPKMAADLKTAQDFCEQMLAKVSSLRDAEMQRLLNRKLSNSNASGEPPSKKSKISDEKLNAWDLSFYSDILKREELSLDDEKLKEFFPLEGTIERLLSIYTELLGLHFVKTTSLPTWHEDVITFEVKRDGNVMGHLYLDQFPRDGKFGHQMIVPLAPSFVNTASGRRCVPACANISNLPRGQGDKPALLRFEEMRTLFHELGHAMHCLCTTTRFSLLSWAWPMVPWPGGVEQDFLELPSMALEKYASEPTLLARVAKHYSGAEGPGAPRLGQETIDKIKMLDKFMVGCGQSRYFSMALFDLLLHSQEAPYKFGEHNNLSLEELHRKCLEEHTKFEQLKDTHPCASWYHLVIGYDAGYYGYGWSDVYAADAFATLLAHPKGSMSPEAGAKLRDEILGPCATRSGSEMLRRFLGREPTPDAWCRRMGITE